MTENDLNDLIEYIRSVITNTDSPEEMDLKFRKFWRLCEALEKK